MNRKKKRQPQRKRARTRPTPTVSLAQPLLVKRKNEGSPSRPRKHQRTKAPVNVKAQLRELTLEQKLQEKKAEEQLRDRLQKELEYLSQPDSNLFDFDPFLKKIEEKPSTPVRLPKKRKRKKVVEPAFTEFVADSDVEEVVHTPVLVSQPIEELSIHVPPVEEIKLPNILKDSIELTDDAQLQAEQDANTIQRILSLRKDNLWTPKRIPRIPAPPRPKTQWDYLLEEMVWMANDFRQERKLKIMQASWLVRAVTKKQREQEELEEKRKQEEHAETLRVASSIARDVMQFWSKVETLVKRKKQGEVPVSVVPESKDELMEDHSTPSSPKDSQIMEMEESDSPISESVGPEERKEIINRAVEDAAKRQPLGSTLSTTNIKTKIPRLLHGTLREYQHIGLDWLVSMNDAKYNVILGDEIGLGKTVQTIALLAHLASECELWGPHLIVVPTSLITHWEYEFKQWCPTLKVSTYSGSKEERKEKRNDWVKPDAFHVCITSYNLLSQENTVFRRKKWYYLILDESQNIKNFRSQKWRVLLNFNSRRRLLLASSPVQTNPEELCSLVHFLMPHIIQSHSNLQEWFSDSVPGTTTTNSSQQLISRLHAILRPFTLRRLKTDLTNQIPKEHQHIVSCNLSARQQALYDEILSQTKTQESLASGNYLNLLNILMQLQRVCNHPNLCAERSFSSPLQIPAIPFHSPSIIWNVTETPSHKRKHLSKGFLDINFPTNEDLDSFYTMNVHQLMADPRNLLKLSNLSNASENREIPLPSHRTILGHHAELLPFHQRKTERSLQQQKDLLEQLAYIQHHRTSRFPLYGSSFRQLVQVGVPVSKSQELSQFQDHPSILQSCILSPAQRFHSILPMIHRYSCYIPPVCTPTIDVHSSATVNANINLKKESLSHTMEPLCNILYPALKLQQLALPEELLIQLDSGKLQKLAGILQDLKAGHRRPLLCTQITQMLDILEIFLNLHHFKYIRMDGTTNAEQRSVLVERFNSDPRIFVFLLSTRCGTYGMNFSGADTIIYYDSDWNSSPMHEQSQISSHRIGQTKDIHIYKLITIRTPEENIVNNEKVTNYKTLLESANEGGNMKEFFQNVDISSFIQSPPEDISREKLQRTLDEIEDERDILAAREAQKELHAALEEFSDSLQFNSVSANNDSEFIRNKLTTIQKYAHQFLEQANSVEINQPNNVQEVAAQTDHWKRDTIQQMKETTTSMDKDEKLIIYEVTGPVSKAIKSFTDGSLKVYGPPVPPPILNAKRDEKAQAYEPILYPDHIYTHPFDYDPDIIDDSLFSEYAELFDWAQPPVIVKPTIEEIVADKKQKRGVSTEKQDKKRVRNEGRGSSNSRKKSSRSTANTTENLFSYKQSSRKPTPSSRRKRNIDESLLVKVPFSQEEDAILMKGVSTFNGNWILLSDILNSSMIQFVHRTPQQCEHHYHTNLSPYKSTKKLIRKGSQPNSPAPDVEYQAEPFSKLQVFQSLLKLVDEAMKHSVPQQPKSCPEPHPSHLDVHKGLGLNFGMTPADVIRLQGQRAAIAPPAFQNFPPTSAVEAHVSNHPHYGVSQPVSSLNTPGLPIAQVSTSNVNMSSIPSQVGIIPSQSVITPPTIPRSALPRPPVQYSKHNPQPK